MQKQPLFLIGICENILKYSIYALVFLAPVLFLPWTSDALDFNKQAVLVLFVFTALFAWMAKVLISGRLSLSLNKTHIAVLALFLITLASTIFSLDKYGSFWGWPSVTSESLLTLTCLALLYFLVSNVFSKKDIFISITLLAMSGLFVVLLGAIQLFGLFLPFSFSKSASFNTIGMTGALGLFTAILLPLLVILVIHSNKKGKIVFGISIIISTIVLALVNYAIVWWVVLAGCAMLILFGVVKKEFFDLRWLGIPVFFLALALFFIIVKIQVPAPQRPLEVYLKQGTSIDIALKTVKDRPILGSGPGTFPFNFAKYKSADLNQGILWNIKFNSAGSKILTVLATTGILGLASFLSLIAFMIFYGVKFILSRNPDEERRKTYFSVFALGVLAAFAGQALGLFLYGSNLTLDFLFFFLIACFIGLTSEDRREFLLNPSSPLTLGVTFLATSVFIFGLGLLVLEGQRYTAEAYYTKGVSAFASGQKQQGTLNLEKAVRLNPKADIYLTRLSEAYLLQLRDVIGDNNLSDKEKSEISQFLVNNSVNAAKLATDASPKNANNWSARGFVYQNLIGTIPDSDDWALNSYSQAIALEPTNPYYPTQQGIVYMAKASAVDRGSESKINEYLDSAKKQFEKAIELKSDYAPARFQIAMLYQKRGQTQEELLALEEAKKLSPNDVGLLFQLGLVYYQKEDFNSAKLNLEEAVSLSPNYANAMYFLGLTYYNLGQIGKAREQFSEVLRLNPGNEHVELILDNLNSGKNPLSGISQEILPQTQVEEHSAQNP